MLNSDSIISIIIPTFNRAHHIINAISSVIDQSFQNWELIVIDDGSTDSTAQLFKNYKDPRIRYFHQQNAGVSKARNLGASKAKGNYLLFLDSDDCLKPDLLQRLENIKYWNYDLICWEVLKLLDGQVSIWKPVRLEKIYNFITATFLAGSICYKKEIFEKTGGFDPLLTYGENYELGLRISQIKNLKIKILKEPFLIYNLKSVPGVNANHKNKLDSIQYMYNKHQNLYLSDFVSHARLTYQIGLLKQKAGNYKEAKQFYKKSLRINPFYLKPLLRIPFLISMRRLKF